MRLCPRSSPITAGTILDLYDSKERYDVFEEYNKAISRASKMESGNAMTIIICNIILIGCATFLIDKNNNKRHQELLNALGSNKKVNHDKKN